MTRLHEAQQLVTGDWRPEHRPVHCTQCMFWLDGWSLEEGGEELGSVSRSQDRRSDVMMGVIIGRSTLETLHVRRIIHEPQQYIVHSPIHYTSYKSNSPVPLYQNRLAVRTVWS